MSAFFDGETIGGEVGDGWTWRAMGSGAGKADGCADIALETGEALSRESINEVDADVVYAGIVKGIDGKERLTGGVATVDGVEDIVGEGLDSHADAVDAVIVQEVGKGSSGAIVVDNVVGVALKGNLGI